ncbi:SAV_2336 N-terminal domain-related protein [Streptomyces clavifer]|uniref:SAV_2336 N-terminal domain-related protein n=1 Tax=Streptomyces clavifer TaxID=68188 RepID=UPI00308B6677|nr:SAV_2336 family protein [Streptomyces clavifer]
MPESERLGTVLQVLAAVGQDLDAQGVLDVLWLARSLSDDPAPLPLAAARSRPPLPADETGAEGHPTPEPDQPAPSELKLPDEDLPDLTLPGLHAAPLPPPTGVRESAESRVPDREEQSRPGMPVRVPEEKALAQELLVGRSLRPLKRRRPSRWRSELDERATAAALAEAWLPDVVMRPVRERWLDLVLVVDDGISMLLWQRLTADLQATLQRLGAFRSLRVYGLDSTGSGEPALRGRPFDPASAPLSPSLSADPSGRTLVLVLSDGMGAAWRQGRMHPVLARWARCGPTAVVHTLPPGLWESSGIQADRWQVTTRHPGAANSRWLITDQMLPPELTRFPGTPVPVLEPTAEALHDWARLLTSPGTTVGLPLLGPARLRTLMAPSRGERGVQHFRDAASPEAYRLAAHLAAVSPVSVPVMRLVQNEVPWQARTTHLAEVFLGGLLRPVAAPVAGPLPVRHQVFDFAEEDRPALLDALPSAELLATSRRIGRRLGQLAGRSPDFPVWLAHQDGQDRVPEALRSFTAVERRLLVRLGVTLEPLHRPVPGGYEPGPATDPLGSQQPHEASSVWAPLTRQDPVRLGPYRLLSRRTDDRSIVYRAHDGQGGEAAVRVIRPDLPPATAQLLVVEAEALRRMNGRYSPALLASGLGHDPPWIAMQLVSDTTVQAGQPPTLGDLIRFHTEVDRAPFDILTGLTLGWHLAGALSICHMSGLVPAALTEETVVVLQRSVVLTGLIDCAVDGEYAGSGPLPSQADNVRALGELLRRISSKRQGTTYGMPDGMHLWQGDTWQSLREIVGRCLAQDPLRRPTAAEVTKVLARYVALARGRPMPGARRVDEARSAGARPALLLSPVKALPDVTTLRIGPRPLFSTRTPKRSRFYQQLAELRRPLSQSLRITFAGAQPGCGRATTCLALGGILASVRGEPVLAVDGAPTSGDLYGYLLGRNPRTPHELAGLPADASYGEIRAYTTRSTGGVEVLAHANTHSTASPAYADEYRRIMAMTARHYPVVLSDWAGSRIDRGADTVLAHTDRLVLCCTDAAYSVGAAVRQLDDLRADGWERVVDEAVVVCTTLGGSDQVMDEQTVRATVADRARAVVAVPFDLHLAGPRPRDLSRIRPRAAEAFAKLARELLLGAP